MLSTYCQLLSHKRQYTQYISILEFLDLFSSYYQLLSDKTIHTKSTHIHEFSQYGQLLSDENYHTKLGF